MSEDKTFVVVVGALFLSFMLLIGALVFDTNTRNARKHEAFQSCILARGIWVDTRDTGTCIIIEHVVQE
jgi:hypothetical protein